MACSSHPHAATHLGLCAACLLEQALTFETAGGSNLPKPLTIQLPLGCSPAASVFLVTAHASDPRLLRLKRWHAPAPAGFLAGFERLAGEFAGWNPEGIAVPLAAGIDGAQRPWVLSEFRQGVPMLERLHAGRLDPDAAAAMLLRLRAVTRRAHERGLGHGSLVAGNVIVHPGSSGACLIDFGIAPLLAEPPDHAALVAADLAGFDALDRAVRGL